MVVALATKTTSPTKEVACSSAPVTSLRDRSESPEPGNATNRIAKLLPESSENTNYDIGLVLSVVYESYTCICISSRVCYRTDL